MSELEGHVRMALHRRAAECRADGDSLKAVVLARYRGQAIRRAKPRGILFSAVALVAAVCICAAVARQLTEDTDLEFGSVVSAQVVDSHDNFDDSDHQSPTPVGPRDAVIRLLQRSGEEGFPVISAVSRVDGEAASLRVEVPSYEIERIGRGELRDLLERAAGVSVTVIAADRPESLLPTFPDD